jgi:tyrosine-specific transport protein
MFMTLAAFVLLEVNLRFGVEVSLSTMAERTYGFLGKTVVLITFLFLFYALDIAYVAGGTSIIQVVVTRSGLGDFSSPLIAFFLSFLGFCSLIFGYHIIIAVNRWLMAILLLSYVMLCFFCVSRVDVSNLSHQNWQFALFTLPVMMVSFGFQNLIPSLNNIYEGRIAKMWRVLWLGGVFTLLIYLVWQTLVLGIIPLNGPLGILDTLSSGREAAAALVEITSEPIIGVLTTVFALSAILTSFLAQSLSLVDFLADLLGMDKNIPFERAILCLLVILPSFVVVWINPTLFIKALSFAGGVCAMVLFGLMPALMCYRLRYGKDRDVPGTAFKVVGGRPLLWALASVSIGIIAIELYREIAGVAI